MPAGFGRLGCPALGGLVVAGLGWFRGRIVGRQSREAGGPFLRRAHRTRIGIIPQSVPVVTAWQLLNALSALAGVAPVSAAPAGRRSGRMAAIVVAAASGGLVAAFRRAVLR